MELLLETGNRLRPTLVLPIVGLDGRTMSGGRNPGFSSGRTNNADHLILISSTYFQSAVVPGGRNTNPPPSAIPARYTQAKDGAIRFCWAMRFEDSFRFTNLPVRRVVPLTFLLKFTAMSVLFLLTPAQFIF